LSIRFDAKLLQIFKTEDKAPDTFSPDRWHDHFRRSRDQVRIYGRTAIGRATVALLRFNSADEQRARQMQRDYLSDIFLLR
jgi:hypothetical protein